MDAETKVKEMRLFNVVMARSQEENIKFKMEKLNQTPSQSKMVILKKDITNKNSRRSSLQSLENIDITDQMDKDEKVHIEDIDEKYEKEGQENSQSELRIDIQSRNDEASFDSFVQSEYACSS